MTVSAKEVQELRKLSGAGMMECKSALSDANGDIDQAFKLLRQKGIAKAEKKSSREANEGLIGIKIQDDKASIVEINSETDFVSRNSEFHELVTNILDTSITNHDNLEKTRSIAGDLINQAVGKIGENIVLRRIENMKGNIFSYVHNSVSDGLGKIGVLAEIVSNSKEIDDIGKNICMHIAASSPKSISKDDIDKAIVDAEKEILNKQLKETGKPADIIDKMMEGKLKKFYEETTLLNQKFIMDPSISVQDYLRDSSEQVKSQITVKKYIRFEIGL